jgi:hypothetical protein
MMTLLWKVGNTYHLCGEGAEHSSYASLAGDYLRLFLPVVDINDSPRFVTRNGRIPGSMYAFDRSKAEEEEDPSRRNTPVIADEEPPAAQGGS